LSSAIIADEPLTDGHAGIEGALFPGWPIAILSRTGLGHPLPTSRSLGTSRYENDLANTRKTLFQSHWWNIFASPDGGKKSCSGGGTITWLSNLLEAQPGSGDERSINWDNCSVLSYAGIYHFGGNGVTSEGIRLDGSARLHYDDVELYTIAWDTVDYHADSHSWRITGVETSLGRNGCGFDRQRLSNLLIESLDSAESILIENMRTTIVGEAIDSRVCGASGLFNNWFSGRMLHSRLGAVVINTDIHLNFLSLSPTIGKNVGLPVISHVVDGQLTPVNPIDPSATSNGEITINGANGSTVKVNPQSFQQFGGVHQEQYYAPQVEALTINIASSDRAPIVVRFERGVSGSLRYGALADLADDDLDGMPNAWEHIRELDPKNPMDGSDDLDDDGVNNTNEFLQLTNPYSYEAQSLVNDSTFELSTWADQTIRWVVIETQSTAGSIERKNWPITLTLVGDAQFAATSGYISWYGTKKCEYGGSKKTLTCEWPSFEKSCDWNGCRRQGNTVAALPVEFLGNTPVTFSATVEPGSADPNRDNDTEELVLKPL